MIRARLSRTSLLLAGATLLALFVFIAATTSSNDFLFIPDTAKPVASKVTVEGGHEPENGGGLYFVDVSLRKARWLERLLPFLQPDGSSLVPQHAVTSPGESFAVAERTAHFRALVYVPLRNEDANHAAPPLSR